MQKKSDDKYKRILQASIEVISEKGLHKASISEIAKKAGIAQGTFYLYFKSKHDLIPAIADYLLTLTLKSVQEEVKEGESFWDTLKVLIADTFKITEKHKDIIVLVYSGLAFNHSLDKWELVYEPYYSWLGNVMEKAVKQNEIRSTTNVKWTSKTIINLIENAAERYYIGQEQDQSLEKYQAELFNFIKRSLLNE
ncbi:TetR family transcriptional regulator [Priestia endophytica]|jgi:AcrR family transcriptional regulator|uniref:Transcriptional regulator, TetR family n=1 Tax=Priestia endophytica DSM 13796 TaxID=1121089 RepID=A0A1I6B1L1_9BACI|nr:TetR family transcriptional regulator [Priestia endophytica]KAB2489446.1 TetR/AcrR family transcriptional regulator [Priestia endophytica]KYG26882.1 TetR family transcriptional regulator [Priestia endophytica]MBG9812872.1 TetR family transcriptional regulator [Priestia endophytica]MCM3538270.1 TetR family transcriptional regulator [Priestia endophytica]MED4074407.1 TetR family transcriptional regulator [Priestia endophytica]